LQIRNQLIGKDENRLIGIYTGKFGGLYLKEEAFEIFATVKKLYSSFFLMILTPENKDEVKEALTRIGFTPQDYFVDEVKHHQLPEYLSAADIAFSFHRPLSSMKYVSPIKNGEYWANGLPILMPDGVGDDSSIVNKNRELGETFNLHYASVENSISALVSNIVPRENISELAVSFRSAELDKEVYNSILSTKF
jgi:hypothetical protein